MSWRTIVISTNSKLDYQMGYLVVRNDITKKVYLNEISILIIESTAVSLTACLLNELMKRKIKVIFCDEKRNPSSELVPYFASHDTSIKIRKQIEWSKSIKTDIWTEIVSEKIRKQAELLKRMKKSEESLLRTYLLEIEYGDATNREGHAAKVYFNALFGKEFTRTAENSINAMLNYGYSIILSAFNREISANGYMTQIGLFHENMFNPFNLACDLMEPFRPLVDLKVLITNPECFEIEEKTEVLRVLEQEVYIAGKCEYVNNAIKIYCRSIFEAINEQDLSLIKFYQNEL